MYPVIHYIMYDLVQYKTATDYPIGSYINELNLPFKIYRVNLSSTYRRAPTAEVSWISTATTCSLPSVANLNSSWDRSRLSNLAWI